MSQQQQELSKRGQQHQDDQQQHKEDHDQQDKGGGDQEYDHNPLPRRTGGVSHPFPQKLHSLLESQVHEDIISWQLDGMAFAIYKPQDFVAAVLPNVFNQTKLKSFQRQLSFYNFKRIKSGPDAGAYRHPLFIRGMPHLCRNITRGDHFTRAPPATIVSIASRTSTNSSSNPTNMEHLGVTRTPPAQEKERQQQEEDDHDHGDNNHVLLEKEQVWNSNAPNQRAPVLEPIRHDFFERMERAPSSITPSNLLGLFRSSNLPAEQLLPNNNNNNNNNNNSVLSPIVEVSPLLRLLQHSNGSYFLCSTPAAPINNKNINNNDNNIIRTKDDVTSTTFITKKRIDEAIREAVENVNDAIRKSLENFHSSLQTIANESFTASHSSFSKTTTSSTSVAAGRITDMLDIGTDTSTSTIMMSSSTTSAWTTSTSNSKNETKSSSTNDNSKLSMSADAVNHRHQNLLRISGENGLSLSSENPLLLLQFNSFDSNDTALEIKHPSEE